MCNFFSIVSDGKGKYMYFDWTLREKCLSSELEYEPDSHTSIADYYGYKGAKEDTLNKYEYNPLTGKFTVDQINTQDDRTDAELFVRALDFKTIIPQLIIKPIVYPFKIVNELTDADIADLKKWASVWASVGDSVRASVWASVWDSVWASVRDSVRASVWASVRASVWASVWAYTSSFIDVQYKYDFTPCIRLWERGFVASYDGKTWRLHSGKDAKIVYTMEGGK